MAGSLFGCGVDLGAQGLVAEGAALLPFYVTGAAVLLLHDEVWVAVVEDEHVYEGLVICGQLVEILLFEVFVDCLKIGVELSLLL